MTAGYAEGATQCETANYSENVPEVSHPNTRIMLFEIDLL